MTPEEQLAKILKQNQNIVFGKTIGTDGDGNCTVQTGESSILARSGGQISAGDCVAMKADDGQWYAVSSRPTGTVQRSVLFGRKNKPIVEEVGGSALKAIINTRLVGEGDIKAFFLPDGFSVASPPSNTGDGQGFYATYIGNDLRFSRIEDNQEVLFKDLPNPLGEYDGSVIETSPSQSRTENRGFIFFGVAKNFFLFASYTLVSIENYSLDIEGGRDELLGFKGSSVTFNSGYVNLTNNTSSTDFSSCYLQITKNGENEVVFGTVPIPMPEPINSTMGRWVLYTFDEGKRLSFGTNDRILAVRDDNILFNSYFDFALRYYTGDSYLELPPDFHFYSLPIPPRKYSFISSIQINEGGAFLLFLGITEENTLLYVTKNLDDSSWSEIKELELEGLDQDILGGSGSAFAGFLPDDLIA